MSARWYRAYEGTVTDAKLGEVALVAGCSRSVAIAAWHSILESAATENDGGRFEATPRRVAVILGEPLATVEAVFAELEELGMICNGCVEAWKRRQFESDTSTERSRKHRERKRNADATLHDRCATPPETETETEKSTSGASAPDAPAPKMIGKWPEADVVRARQDLVAAYGGGLDAPPDVAGTFNTWVAAYGWEPAVIVAAVAGRITDPEKRKKPLRYWENAVREVFTKRAAAPPPAEPEVPAIQRRADFEKVAVSTWLGLVDIWKINRKWSEYYGPAPNEPGCHVPPEVLERFNLKPVVAVLQ